MGFFTGASDALQELLVEQEKKKRQDMLDAILMEDRKSLREDRKTNREIQRDNAASLKAQREEAAAAAKQAAADKFENSTAMGTELDDAGAGILEAAGRGSHIKRTPVSGSLRVTNGLGPSTADNPLGLDTSKAPAATIVEGKRLFGGTAKQQEDARQRESRAAYIASLPVGSRPRQVLEAQDATGDNSISASVFDDPDEKRRQSLEDREHLLRVAASLRPPREPRARFDVKLGKNASGQDVIIRTNVDGGAIEVIPVPDGVTINKPAQPKTPAELEAEARARARGTATGKTDVKPASGGILSSLAGIFGSGPQRTGATPPAGSTGAPNIGDTKTFPNGKVGVWDGSGQWLQK